jgi:AhpD family alkylhydroperoxidase
MSQLRLPYFDLSAEALMGLRNVKSYLENSALNKTLLEWVYLRVSQINGCSFCLKLHSKALRATGENAERLDSLAGWHCSPLFSEQERAAFQWAESLSQIAITHAPDADFDLLKKYFNDQEISDLTFAIANMNALNRVAIAMRQ